MTFQSMDNIDLVAHPGDRVEVKTFYFGWQTGTLDKITIDRQGIRYHVFVDGDVSSQKSITTEEIRKASPRQGRFQYYAKVPISATIYAWLLDKQIDFTETSYLDNPLPPDWYGFVCKEDFDLFCSKWKDDIQGTITP